MYSGKEEKKKKKIQGIPTSRTRIFSKKGDRLEIGERERKAKPGQD